LTASPSRGKRNLSELAGRAIARIGNLVRIQRAFLDHNWDDSLDMVIARVLEDFDGIPANLLLPGNEDIDSL
jgi:hypothetical protein